MACCYPHTNRDRLLREARETILSLVPIDVHLYVGADGTVGVDELVLTDRIGGRYRLTIALDEDGDIRIYEGETPLGPPVSVEGVA